MQIKCVVAGTNSNGEPDLWFCIVECTQAEHDDGDHYDAAADEALLQGYESPFVVFDENDPPRAIFEHFVWDSATIVQC